MARIEKVIHLVRGEKILLDADLARLYGVTTSNLNKAVKRNHSRFPADFMFQLTDDETRCLMFQFGISNNNRGGRRHNPYAFTEQGVAMLSSILRSECAVQVNLAIMRAFVSLRRMLFFTPPAQPQSALLSQRRWTICAHRCLAGPTCWTVLIVPARIRSSCFPRVAPSMDNLKASR